MSEIASEVTGMRGRRLCLVDSMQSAKAMMAEEDRAERTAAGEPEAATLESLQSDIRELRAEVRALRTTGDAER